ncbi:UNVERIFIED_CONTAM: hypothetical protein FKN15_053052 [Acipenser sinensis]
MLNTEDIWLLPSPTWRINEKFPKCKGVRVLWKPRSQSPGWKQVEKVEEERSWMQAVSSSWQVVLGQAQAARVEAHTGHTPAVEELWLTETQLGNTKQP